MASTKGSSIITAVPKKVDNIIIEDARLTFKNFSGKENRYNAKGVRNFAVLLDPEIASVLSKDGWHVKVLKPRNQDEAEQAYLPVKVAYANYPPMVTLINSGGKELLREDTIHILDWAEIQRVDLIIKPYVWEVGGNTGIKAYLKTMYVTAADDPFYQKYRDVGLSDGPDEPNEDDLPF